MEPKAVIKPKKPRKRTKKPGSDTYNKFIEGTGNDYRFPKPVEGVDTSTWHFIRAFRIIHALNYGVSIDELSCKLSADKSKCVMYLKMIDLYVHPIISKKVKGKNVYKFDEDGFFDDI